MSADGQFFIDHSRELLTDSYLPRIERCVEKLTDEQIWWRANPGSNSIANLMLHLSGNVRQWIVSGIGGAPDVRQRQQEFDARGPLPRAEVVARLRNTVQEADRVLAGVEPAALLEPRRIQGYDVNVMEAIYQVVEHFSMHTGQIILLAKMWVGDVAFFDASQGTPRRIW
jgi:hypothetical protein